MVNVVQKRSVVLRRLSIRLCLHILGMHENTTTATLHFQDMYMVTSGDIPLHSWPVL